MGPSSIDAEIRSLGPSAGGDVKLVEAFMLFLEHQLQSRRDFEFTEGIMGLFLKVRSILMYIQTLLSVSNFGGGQLGVPKPSLKILGHHIVCLRISQQPLFHIVRVRRGTG